MSADEILYSLMVFVMVSSGFTVRTGIETVLHLIDYAIGTLHLKPQEDADVSRSARKFACWFAIAVGSGLMFHILMTQHASSGNTLF